MTNIEDEFRAAMTVALSGLLEGVAADLEGYVAAIQVDMLAAVAANDESWMAELSEQAEAIAETHRLRAATAAWAAVGGVMVGVMSMAAGALRAAAAGGVS